uniref:Uncharacterized protein n=1 Tax=Parascaris univalens TaxID=6257 RepID=A0A915ATB4_PARUN
MDYCFSSRSVSQEMTTTVAVRSAATDISSPSRSNGVNRKSLPNGDSLSKSSNSSTSGAGSSIRQRNSPKRSNKKVVYEDLFEDERPHVHSEPVTSSVAIIGGVQRRIVSRNSSTKTALATEQTKHQPDWDVSSLENESVELEHDSDTGMESMSSAEVPHSNRLSCSFCLESTSPVHGEEIRRLDELLSDVEKLKCEKADLLKQNVSCKTDIKKLKQRQSILASDLDKANEEITRLRKLLKRPSACSEGFVGVHHRSQIDEPAAEEPNET